jgi:phosphoglycerate kinase
MAKTLPQKIRSISEINLSGRRVFIRLDFEAGAIEEELSLSGRGRLNAVVPTIRHALDAGARVVLASHVGHEKGRKHRPRSLEPEGTYLAEVLNCEVLLTDECVGDAARKVVSDLREGQIALLENLSFSAGEKANDDTFARELAQLTDVYVNEAFGACRFHYASICTLPRLIQERAIGLLMEKELRAATTLIHEVPRPFLAVLGGSKLPEKMPLLDLLVEHADGIAIGGGIANTFMAAQGVTVGRSEIERRKVAWARSLLQRAVERDVPVLLPQDLQIIHDSDDDTGCLVAKGEMSANALIADLGPRTIKSYCDKILRSGSVFWYGPLGICEKSAFSEATIQVAQAIAASGGFTVIGGDSTVAFIRNAGMNNVYSHVSEGGPALLDFMAGTPLPGLESLQT